MNQEKIGKFIMNLRKEKGLTQKDLALKLNVTDRTISNWENGKNMPDLSLFIPLCSILNISVNELINGEKLNNNMENFQENVIKTMVYSHNETHKAFKILIIFIFVIIFSFILFQKKVLDSYKESSNILDNMFYYENTNITIIKKIIRKSLLSNKPKKDIITIQYEGETDSVTKEVTLDNFASFKIFKIEETKNEEINVYLIALVGSYYQDDISIYEIYSQSLQFYKYTLKKNDTSYEIVDIITTEEKEKLSEYDNFSKLIFPKMLLLSLKNIIKPIFIKTYILIIGIWLIPSIITIKK